MASLGWRVPRLELWLDHEFGRIVVGPNTFRTILSGALQRARALLWVNASHHHLGAGLERSPPHDVSFKFARSLGESRQLSGLMECILAGGVWTPYRVYEATAAVDPVCARCGCLVNDLRHMVWDCPAIKEVTEKVVTATNHLTDRAADASLECWFLRGLLPAALIRVPPPLTLLLQYVLALFLTVSIPGLQDGITRTAQEASLVALLSCVGVDGP